MQISTQEFERNSGSATDEFLLHSAKTLQRTNIPYFHAEICLRYDQGGVGQKLYEGCVYCFKEKLVSGTDLRPSQNTFPTLTHILLQGFPVCKLGIHHWWP